MKLFLFEIRTKKKRLQLQVVVYAKDEDRARLHLGLKHPGHEVLRCIALPEETRHFVVGELEEER